jgi:Leucine-rich repeat (LRR) protein
MEELTPEEIALKRIEIAYKTNTTKLDLASIVDNQLYPITSPSIKDIEDWESGTLTTLPKEIGKVVNVTALDISLNKLAAVPSEIGQLVNLTTLNISYNQLTALPAEIGKLINLTSFDLSGNHFTRLPVEIGQLTKLISLDLSSNQLTSLPMEIGELENLEILSVIHNNVTELPFEIIKLRNLKHLDLRNNELKIPPEILEKTDDPIAILSAYFGSELINYRLEDEYNKSIKAWAEALDKRSTHKLLNEAKSMIVGQGSVGKTSLVQQILHGTFDPNQSKTDGISISYWQLEGQERQARYRIGTIRDPSIKLNIWDFGG